MKSRDWKDVAELIGIVAIVASLIFVGLQMQQSQRIAQAERRNMRVANGIEVTNAINAYADIWARGNEGEHLDPAEAVVFENLVWNMNSFRVFGATAAELLGNQRGVRANQTAMALFLAKNPGAHQVWIAHEEELIAMRKELMPGYDLEFWFNAVRTDIERIEQLRSR
jgi:hypothetical protein